MSRYDVRPRADQDLDEQADYYAAHGSHGLGHRFLIAAHDTFAHLASQPGMGWRFKFKRSGLESIRVFPVSGFVRILILYRPIFDGVEILRLVHGSRNIQALFRREKPN